MKTVLLSRTGEESRALIFESGDEVVASLADYARREGVRAAHFTGIGAFRSAILGYFDWETKQYLETPIDEQVEVLVLTGDIAWRGSDPVAHVHVVVGCRDGSAKGGHLLRGIVRPTLEVAFSQAGALERSHDPESGLALISPEATRKDRPAG